MNIKRMLLKPKHYFYHHCVSEESLEELELLSPLQTPNPISKESSGIRVKCPDSFFGTKLSFIKKPKLSKISIERIKSQQERIRINIKSEIERISKKMGIII